MAAAAAAMDGCASSCLPPAGGPGARLIYAGKLQRARHETTITGESPTALTTASIVGLQEPKPVAAACIVEADLVLADYDEDKDDDGGLMQKVPGALTGRRLMQARAQQCVVCLTESEHTFVPPHRAAENEEQRNTSPTSVWRRRRVDGHRFCPDCWTDFIEHHMEQINTRGKKRVLGLSRLVCPVCRDPIDMPDVWTVRLGLHRTTVGLGRQPGSRIPSLSEVLPQLPHRTEAVSQPPAADYGDLTPSDVWASRREERWQGDAGGDSSSDMVLVTVEPDLSSKSNAHIGVERSEVNNEAFERQQSWLWAIFLVVFLPLLLLFVVLVVFGRWRTSRDSDDWSVDTDDNLFSSFLGFEQGVLL